jgi:predicted transcriptional regulator of viral defense system
MAGTGRDKKRELSLLAGAAEGGVIGVRASAEALGVSTRVASARLAAWTRAGWLARVRRGLYFVLPLESESESRTTVEDPWLLADALFSPCYIGGWSAAEHWGMTEQLFRSTFVATTSNIRKRSMSHLGATFTLVRVRPDRLQHLTPVWRGSTRVLLSSRERTIVDAAVDPRWVGGIRHMTDVFTTYSTDRNANADALLQELRRSGNGAAAKRIGFLAEKIWPSARNVIEGALKLRSKGVVKLDPMVRRHGPINSRWGLWVNVSLRGIEAD